MQSSPKVIFKNLRPHIADAIKESCYKTDLRIYNVANEIRNIISMRTLQHLSTEPGVDIAQDLSKIIDKTVQDSVGLGCDLSVIVKGIMLGAFRASPFIRQEAHKTIRILIEEIIQTVFKYNGDIKQAIEGILTAIVMIAREFKLNLQEALTVAKEDILNSAKAKDPKFADDIKEIFAFFDDS